MKTPLLLLLRAYKLGVSPFLGQNCRFYPSCSDYAAEAVRVHGALKGSLLAGKRLCKCHPWHPGGLDFVPGSAEARAHAMSQSSTSSPDFPNTSSQPQAARVSPPVAADGCSHS
ncbi:membrane protein insertion efficiency factor YidD [Herbaspirillum sp. AP02]|uniref:membrane protein insertion efficiency factor YidD n=1 Tax=unclassified Herbaspirillum TaxID=2624150 RepID=UPI0015D96750|nr:MULTISPECIES: membrane protein insertion efficiency factor YidD [unclassified Herbaspirillum]MBG7620913.1 membrane protein insertion efficiency factor YidD [Herbaspirillum sp. AP02]NZD68376.1 membrane protein insertion efficiency factor YidD [Herbaspirillum sp. AP21]